MEKPAVDLTGVSNGRFSAHSPETTKTPTNTGNTNDIVFHSSDNITVQTEPEQQADSSKPSLLKHVSTPAYSSPLRHHRRHPSTPRQVKETLDARSEYLTSQDDGSAEHRINQYIIKQEIGRGSFGAVHIAVDQYGTEYAVKEFSKARLRKRAQSHILRKPLNQRRRGALQGFNSPLHRRTGDLESTNDGNPLELIKEEIAIMKKLNHSNLVQLIEVLDDPTEDSLYMVMEMCKKGVVMQIDLDLGSQADPYPEETCRLYFRDLILGIEYLHAQGIVHRDIKPDNCLINHEDVLKVVDFGVSEMFEKDSEMLTAKSAGSPAFLPPELCVVKHGDVSGRAADIWSMGVTLYCLRYGKIPFQHQQIFDLYEAIRTEQPDFGSQEDKDFVDLMQRILEKDPSLRIKMPELREHPWVTQRGNDPLLSEAENTAEIVDPPTDAEVNAAITGNMRNLLTVVKAVAKFKSLTAHSRPAGLASILGDSEAARFSTPPGQVSRPLAANRSHSLNLDDRNTAEGALVTEGVHRDPPDSPAGRLVELPKRKPMVSFSVGSDEEDDAALTRLQTAFNRIVGPNELPPFRASIYAARTQDDIGRRGHAHDPLEDQLYLRIGPSTFAGHSSQSTADAFFPSDDEYVVSESPGAADVDIYETAYRDEIERILARAEQENKEPQVYLTRRVDEKLLQLSGLAGKLMAHGEEFGSQIRDYTQFRERRAKATEVSRALREAAKAEYEKRRLERKAWIEAAKDGARNERNERNKILASGATSTVDTPSSAAVSAAASSFSQAHEIPPKPLESTNSWRAKAVDRSRYAKSAFSGLVNQVKKGRRSKDEAS